LILIPTTTAPMIIIPRHHHQDQDQDQGHHRHGQHRRQHQHRIFPQLLLNQEHHHDGNYSILSSVIQLSSHPKVSLTSTISILPHYFQDSL